MIGEAKHIGVFILASQKTIPKRKRPDLFNRTWNISNNPRRFATDLRWSHGISKFRFLRVTSGGSTLLNIRPCGLTLALVRPPSRRTRRECWEVSFGWHESIGVKRNGVRKMFFANNKQSWESFTERCATGLNSEREICQHSVRANSLP